MRNTSLKLEGQGLGLRCKFESHTHTNNRNYILLMLNKNAPGLTLKNYKKQTNKKILTVLEVRKLQLGELNSLTAHR